MTWTNKWDSFNSPIFFGKNTTQRGHVQSRIMNHSIKVVTNNVLAHFNNFVVRQVAHFLNLLAWCSRDPSLWQLYIRKQNNRKNNKQTKIKQNNKRRNKQTIIFGKPGKLAYLTRWWGQLKSTYISSFLRRCIEGRCGSTIEVKTLRINTRIDDVRVNPWTIACL